MKTNKNWYADKKYGSFYKLIDGVLMFSPMFKGGKRDKASEGEVDWDRGVENGYDRVYMEGVVKDLKARI